MQKLIERFPQTVLDLREFRGETIVTVHATDLVPICQFLRDDPELAYTVLLQYVFKLAKRNWTGNPFQIGVILDYLIFKEMEVRTLIAITEAKCIGFSKDTVNQYLINAPEKF